MRRIILAMSGGVDSSVAAHLLQSEGWEVIGVTFDLWVEDSASAPAGRQCCLTAVEDARRVCEMLGIAHRTLDCRDEFRRTVVEEFCDAYFCGRTPNPCVRCNPRIKFRSLLEMMRDLGAEAVATGHYARVEKKPEAEGGRFLLRKGIDRRKEQSYVLCGLGQDQLAHCVFPLGGWEKTNVRAVARELHLQTHDKPESQEICFLPAGDYGAFLSRFTPERVRPGRIVDTSGKFLGRHRGIHHFTLGQRRRLGFAVGVPRYVVRIEPDTATVVVGSKEETFHSGFTVRDVNWIAFEAPPATLDAAVKIRYTHEPAPARIEPIPSEGRAARVTFLAPESAVTPGQAAVFYHDDLVLGGGTIDEVF